MTQHTRPMGTDSGLPSFEPDPKFMADDPLTAAPRKYAPQEVATTVDHPTEFKQGVPGVDNLKGRRRRDGIVTFGPDETTEIRYRCPRGCANPAHSHNERTARTDEAEAVTVVGVVPA